MAPSTTNRPIPLGVSTRLMTDSEARECVAKINFNLTNIRSLVLDLYEREGWSAMGYSSWRECVTAEFKQGQAYLYRQLEAAQTERNISTIVEKADSIPESQLQPLTKLRNEPEKQREAWAKAVKSAPDGKVTASHVSKIVKEMTTTETTKSNPPPIEATEAMNIATFVISHLGRIRNRDPKRQEALQKVSMWIQTQVLSDIAGVAGGAR